MKNIWILTLMLFSTFYNGQDIVVNEKLIFQTQKNTIVRQASLKQFLKSYEKQKEIYDSIQSKMNKVVIIQEYIYDKLWKVNTSIQNGKKLKYIYKDLELGTKNLSELMKITAKHPKYAVLLSSRYFFIGEQFVKLKKELKEILSEDSRNLKDPYDLSVMLERLHQRILVMSNEIGSIKTQLEASIKRAYWKSVPLLNNYINIDRQIAKDIIYRVNHLIR